MAKKIKINSYQNFKNLKQRQIMEFEKDRGDGFGEYYFKDDTDIKEVIKGLRYIHGGFDNVDLRKPVSKYYKEKARQIFNEYNYLKKRENVQEFTPRKKNRKIIGQLAQQQGNWKKYFVPNENSGKTKIDYVKVGNKRVAKVTGNVADYLMLYFDMENLAKDPDKEVEKVLSKFKPKTKKNFNKNFKIMAGQHLINLPFADIKQTKREIKMLMQKYNGQEGASNYQEWLFGVKAIYKFNKRKS